MQKMMAAQKKLEAALLILTGNLDFQQKKVAVYHQCLCDIKADAIPHCIRKDYYHLLRFFEGLFVVEGVSFAAARQHTVTAEYLNESALAMAVLTLLTRLTQWIAIENYLTSQRRVTG